MSADTSTQRWARACVWLLLAVSGWAQAQPRAWLDRDQISDTDAVTLTIETDAGGAPDYGPLQADFELGAQTSSRQVQWSNGSTRSQTRYAVTLSPRRSGTLQIPPLQAGSGQTAALVLQVSADAAAARGNAAVFMDVEVDDATPYVQQSVGVVVRLYYATQLLSGELVLDTPPGASLQRVGEDRSLVREVNGRRYNLVERRFLLIPERSGTLVLPAAQFNGRSAGGFMDSMFGGDGRLRARAPERTLQVQAQPAQAPQPWLPLHDLRLRYTAAPRSGRAGEAATVVIEATAQGATRAQFPELPELDVGPDAQVFAEPAQYDESFNGSSPQLKLTRRYSIVPRQAGTLHLPGPRMAWWDVQAGQARSAELPDLSLAVAAGGATGSAAPIPLDTASALPGGAAAASSAVSVAPLPAPARPWGWIGAAVGFAALWLLTLLWGWRRRGHPRPTAGPVRGPGLAPAGTPTPAELRRALESEGLDEIVALLCAMGGVQGLEALLARLADPRQRDSLLAMQQARWSAGNGDVGQARQALRAAFRDGPHWYAPAVAENNGLPPLYPSGP
ncbi:BatD family protein [Stenotrophomonas rhizophila]|uniref:BatD family protein n=1 Tax=Stenotrophomonas rhizophila TaxID=216778 RepID=UPI001E51E494|nr:BatD family protein [Stenotrophomonas rhizophila]MCC7636005.1 BatD family protein [Stenotrophomonas rhizophila]MCC7665361.1 BatD family protein [Stenotrophomonas rhizophila]